MRLAAKFLALPASDRRLILQAVPLLAAIRVGLVLMPLRHFRWWLAAGVRMLRAAVGGETRDVSRVPWAVAAASRFARSSCLVQALAAQALFEIRGGRAAIHIGARRGPGGAFEAHACVESAGRIVLGRSSGSAYQALARLDRMRP